MKITVEKLRQTAEEILVCLGETSENAGIISNCLVKADMRGVSTHGTYLLKVITQRVQAGQLSLPTRVTTVVNSDATAVVDGADGVGMVAGFRAMELATEKAKQYGIGTVLIRNTNNVGALSCYTQYAALQGMIAIMSCNAAPAMAPWGGAEQFLGTNPISIAIPAGTGCFVADMATSIVARGKIRKADRQGSEIPAGWALDSDGKPTTNAGKALEGTLLPIGGPKGSALAMAVDIISGLLAGSSYGPALRSFHELEGPTGVGASCIAVDVSRFMEIGRFKSLMDTYIESVKTMKRAEGFDEILITGEIEDRKEKLSLKEGMELDPKLVSDLNEILKLHNSNTVI